VDDSDDQLWLRAKNDDSGAFETLFERYATDVYNFCFRRTASWSRAEDLVSEVFLEAWRKRKDLDLTSTATTLKPWLLGVAHNKIRNQSRTFSTAFRAIGRLTEQREEDFVDDAVDRLDDEARMRALNRAVAQLPREEADALLLFSWGQLRYEEVGAVLGIPVGTVRSRLSRARSRLREANPPAHRDEMQPIEESSV
jgi:RNA polymerase sigma-70 factor (ECF subfamily)